MGDLAAQLQNQQFSNDYQLVDGERKHQENPEHFRIPPRVIKRQVNVGHFVELRIDSTRFSIHEDVAEQCECPSCKGVMSKPILRHEHPATLVPLPEQKIPSRGWGEDFWVQVIKREGNAFLGTIDNSLAEARLHGLSLGHQIVFHADNILAVHDVHRQELILAMNEADLKEMTLWLATVFRSKSP
jgi:hypothetical protein